MQRYMVGTPLPTEHSKYLLKMAILGLSALGAAGCATALPTPKPGFDIRAVGKRSVRESDAIRVTQSAWPKVSPAMESLTSWAVIWIPAGSDSENCPSF